MKTLFIICFISISFLSCAENLRSSHVDNSQISNFSSAQYSDSVPFEEYFRTDTVFIESLHLVLGDQMELELDEQNNLYLNVELTNGEKYENVSQKFQTSHNNLNGDVIWYVNNTNIVTITNSGLLTAKQSGSTTVLATLHNITAVLYVKVLEVGEQPSYNDPTEQNDGEPVNDPNGNNGPIEENNDPIPNSVPNDPSHYFLHAGDILSATMINEESFGFDSYPEVLYGPPVSVMDVVSLGSGGEIKIEIHDFFIIDGPGDDFTIYENAAWGWQECAEVSVSEDDQNYYYFECNQFDEDEIYAGCAGVNGVNYGYDDSTYYENPTLAGGDHFDLADLGPLAPQIVKFIKIRDLGLCQPTNGPLFVGNPSGFDLDAVAIHNGVTE